MCGIAGVVNLKQSAPLEVSTGANMLAQLRHRGPDEFGMYNGQDALLCSARLSILDLESGQQPICNEDGTLWVVFNGEIYNHSELRAGLLRRGHRFATRSDTEVLVHLYEEYGASMLPQLNGQFAFAIWDARDQTLFLARDRLGVRPLFYTTHAGRFYFASEIKAILANREIPGELDPISLDEVFHYWSCLTPRTAFRGIMELPPGHFGVLRSGEIEVRRYWELRFSSQANHRSMEEAGEELRSLLSDAVRIRLRADVPVGAYLSGGLDSSLITALIQRTHTGTLRTFSIAFSDPGYDESVFQHQMAQYLGTRHEVVHATRAGIGQAFPDVVWHAETPILRTAPAPMLLLSGLVHECGFKVVLTGEGADEFLGGYDIFKEAAIRQFWARYPNSRLRPRLLERLYPDIGRLHDAANPYLAAFFGHGLTDTGSPFYSHTIRWRNGDRSSRFYSPQLRDALTSDRRLPDLPPDFSQWSLLERAQFLEITVFLSQYLLCSQGDRMGMANSVEGRFPFLDPRVVEFSCALPPQWKLHGLSEKYLLRLLAREYLPPSIAARPKRPYRAPIYRSFFHPAPDYVKEMLSPASIAAVGMFVPATVSQLVRKVESGQPLGETDDMALAGILSTQLLHQQFVAAPRFATGLSIGNRIHLCGGIHDDIRFQPPLLAGSVGS